MLAVFRDGSGLFKVRHHKEVITGTRHRIEAGHTNRHGRARLVDFLVAIVVHRPDSTVRRTTQNHVADPQRSLLHHQPREGTATFHIDYLMDGGIRFEKVCDGNVWKSLAGHVELEDLGERCRVVLRLEGATKRLVPEFTIKGPMEDQINEMSEALEAKLAESS